MTKDRQEEKTAVSPADELEHLALAARISGVEVEIVLPESKEMRRERMRLHYLDWGPPQVAGPSSSFTARR
jgi:hypothetical protein